ncbi:MAG: lipopolysaccharide biosynthesis protein [Lachnospiraceae bacterium]|nr:lipopolysaccharide biosynthesis protein [Lachnospiraceae bacterium]
MNESKVKQVTGGLIWTYAERMTAQLITIIVTIVLARIIAPDEYGIISIVNVFINIANAFVINGFGNSLIQKKDSDELDFSTVFYFSIGFSTIVYLILFICAPFISKFYEMDALTLILRIMGVRLPIAAINSVQQAYISKCMAFKKFFFATLGGTLASAAVGITMAYNGFGIWALVAQYLTNVCIDTVVLSFTSGWRPKLIYSRTRMKGLFSYGWKIMFVGVMTTVYANIRNLVIGKKYNSADLAYSEKGEQFPNAIAGNINSSITKVLFPVLSDLQNDIEQLKRAVRRSIKVGTYVLFPIMFGFAVISEKFVSFFMTEKWIGCVPFLQIMCIVYALQPLQTSSLQAIKAIGKSSLYLWIDIIKKIVGIIILIVTVFCFDDVLIIVFGALVIELFSVIVLFPVNKKLFNYTYREQIMDIAPSMMLSIGMCLVTVAFDNMLQINGLLAILMDIVIGVGTYLIGSVITKNENFKYILGFMLRKRGK